MKVEYSKAAVKAIAEMNKSTRQRIRVGIEGLTAKPPKGDIKPLQGYKDNRYRLRIGSYRIIYYFRIDGTIEVLYIIDIGARGGIYK